MDNIVHFHLVFRSNDGPRYIRAFVVHIVVYGIQLVAIVLLRLHLMRLNVLKRRSQSLEQTKASAETVVSPFHPVPSRAEC